MIGCATFRPMILLGSDSRRCPSIPCGKLSESIALSRHCNKSALHHRQTRTTTRRWLRTQKTGNAQQPHTTTIQTQERHHSPHTTTNTQGNTLLRKATGTPRLHDTRTPVLPTHSTNTHLPTRKRPRPRISRIPPGQRWRPTGHRRTPTTITTRLSRRRN